MNDPRLLEVGARLEESVKRHSAGLTNQEMFDLYEQLCISILDSQWMDFPDGELESYLREFLARKEKELGLPRK